MPGSATGSAGALWQKRNTPLHTAHEAGKHVKFNTTQHIQKAVK